MSEQDIIYHIEQAMLLVLLLSLPTIVVATVVGLLVALFQALTQIQEQTLSFGIKLAAVIVTLTLTARWLGIEMQNFTLQAFNSIAGISL
jgi:type III secretion protein S